MDVNKELKLCSNAKKKKSQGCVGGGFWSGWGQVDVNEELNSKNEKKK